MSCGGSFRCVWNPACIVVNAYTERLTVQECRVYFIVIVKFASRDGKTSDYSCSRSPSLGATDKGPDRRDD